MKNKEVGVKNYTLFAICVALIIYAINMRLSEGSVPIVIIIGTMFSYLYILIFARRFIDVYKHKKTK